MKPYHRPPPHKYWLSRRPYFMFIVREMTSLFIAGFCIFLLAFVYALGQGPKTYNSFIQFLQSWFVVGLHWVVLIFALYHTFTWFNLTPKVMVVWLGEKKIPEAFILAGVYGGWIVVSILVTWVIVGF